MEGRLGKFYEDTCLYEQHFIKDTTGAMTIGELIASKIAKFGENITVRRFARFKVGEGRRAAGRRRMGAAVPPREPVFRRVLLKLSGEALMAQGFGVDPAMAARIAAEVDEVRKLGVRSASWWAAGTSSGEWRLPSPGSTGWSRTKWECWPR